MLPIQLLNVANAAKVWKKAAAESRNILEDRASKGMRLDIEMQGEQIFVLPPPMAGFLYDSASGYLIFDRGPNFNKKVIDTLKTFGIQSKPTSFRSPWQNGVAERWVGNCRRDLLDHVIVLNERHLKLLMNEYVRYYHENRTHLALGKSTPPGARKTNSQAADNELCLCPDSAAYIPATTWQHGSALSTLKSLRATDGRFVPHGADCLNPRVSRCARSSLRCPLPVKIAATTVNKVGNQAHFATGRHFVEAQPKLDPDKTCTFHIMMVNDAQQAMTGKLTLTLEPSRGGRAVARAEGGFEIATFGQRSYNIDFPILNAGHFLLKAIANTGLSDSPALSRRNVKLADAQR